MCWFQSLPFECSLLCRYTPAGRAYGRTSLRQLLDATDAVAATAWSAGAALPSVLVRFRRR
jgi:hypothetical protein